MAVPHRAPTRPSTSVPEHPRPRPVEQARRQRVPRPPGPSARPRRPEQPASPEQPPRPERAPKPTRRRRERRYAVVYDVEGPKVRLGILWFVVAVTALVLGPVVGALCYGAAAAVAAAQVAKAWRSEHLQPSIAVAAGGAGAMALGAVLGAGGLGLALIGTAIAACVVAWLDGGWRWPLLHHAGWTLRCAVPPGVAAACMVLLVRLEVGAAISLLVLVSAYEVGDYLIGSGSSNPYEGPIAGIAAAGVFTFIIAALAIPPFDFDTAWAFGLAAAAMAPLGQLAASALLPSAGSMASGLRRLDSLLLAAPAWAWAVGILIQN
jgi:hypothetical protein